MPSTPSNDSRIAALKVAAALEGCEFGRPWKWRNVCWFAELRGGRRAAIGVGTTEYEAMWDALYG